MSHTSHPPIKKMSPQFLVRDLSRSVEFYTKQLGFDLEFSYEDFYAGIIKNGCSVHLKSGNPSAGERERKRENGDLDIVFSVTGVKDWYRELLNQSADIVQPLCERPYGEEFYIADPDGYILAFLEER